ncbi:MAG: ABC transporter permease [Candidatus Riflebacteria bacterium]|nr:ABC transporter permease [Candidatus Riflebacteria bacterium]
MNRSILLLKFEIKKIMARKKALLFLLGLNVIPILGGILGIIVFIKFKTWGFDDLRLSLLTEAMRGLFTAHLKLFAWIAPFFLSLVIGDSISGEMAKGHMKTLLLTPVTRLQVIISKSLAVMFFLLIAITIGGLFLQTTIWIAKNMSQSPKIVLDFVEDAPTTILSAISAIKLLAISFVANLPVIAYFVLFSLFSESPILMAFSGLFVMMFLQTFVLMAPTLAKFDPFYEKIASWIFTRHPSKLFEIDTLYGIMDGKLNIFDPAVSNAIIGCVTWSIFFFFLSALIFRRKAIPG